ncbi:hypothetical protein [Lacipirellula parvula]|uniref:Uncharacterized protein n=1 Tax=Lacipirellula parvula TaxID=2650471 RepID=A0A5K7XF84_9BACT|nr:hypothetical protein [Lacipirellula parvula]BBO35168.1 hypothetical protein PLANPX_4780 [Lacipirellula parvula]
MRWIVKTLLDGVYCDEFQAEGDPIIPVDGSEIMISADGDRFIPATVMEIDVDKSKSPAVLRIICRSPSDPRQAFSDST